MYVCYVRFVIGFFLLCAHVNPWTNYSVAVPEKMWQCCDAAQWSE